MKINKLFLVYFSPTGTTSSILKKAAQYIGIEYLEYDLADYSNLNMEIKFTSNDLVLFGFPVYGGRVPDPFIERVSRFSGNGALAVIFAAYGNRAYENALFEMRDCVLSLGFSPLAAAAISTEHNMVRAVAAGRPDKNDLILIETFCNKLIGKFTAVEAANELVDFYVPGKKPKNKISQKTKPSSVSKNCNFCGLCARKCPVNAIDINHPKKPEAQECLHCMRCIRYCPKNARNLPSLPIKIAEYILSKLWKKRKEPEFFK